MLRRHQIFNVIIDFWSAHDQSSTPRRGELLRLLSAKGMRMSRQNLKQHLHGLEDDGFLSIDNAVIVLHRKEKVDDIAQMTCPD